MPRFGQDAASAARAQNVASRLSSSMDVASVKTPRVPPLPKRLSSSMDSVGYPFLCNSAMALSVNGHSPVAACASSSHANQTNTAASRIALSPPGRDHIEFREVHIGKTLNVFRRLPVGLCSHRRKRTQSCLAAAPMSLPRKHGGGTAPPWLSSGSLVQPAISRRYPSSTTR